MIAFQQAESLEFWHPHEVASLTPEFQGRVRGVHRDGRVAHRPDWPAEGPWVPLQQCLVHPHWLRETPEGWRDPAGFLLGQGQLPQVALPEPLPEVPGLPCARASIYGLKAEGQSHTLLLTDAGSVVWRSLKPAKAAARLPEMVLLKKGLWANRLRLVRVRHSAKNYFLDVDHGHCFTVSQQVKDLPGRLGLPNLLWLEPRRPKLYGNYQLRDWPFELAEASGKVLQRCFPTPRMLIAHLVWQRFRYIQQGIERSWERRYRDFWYEVVVPALSRCGFLGTYRQPMEHNPYCRLLYEIMDYMVEDCGFFTFTEFGFDEPRPEMRRVGAERPNILLVVEKESLHDYGLRLADEFGVSLRLLGSQPPLSGTEHFARDLAAAVSGPIRVIAYVDYDPGGWIVGKAMVKQLRFFGLSQVQPVEYLIRGDAFTPEEKRRHARPCAMSNKIQVTKTVRWVAESGGVDGQPLGIHADHVRPFERVRELFLQLL